MGKLNKLKCDGCGWKGRDSDIKKSVGGDQGRSDLCPNCDKRIPDKPWYKADGSLNI